MVCSHMFCIPFIDLFYNQSHKLTSTVPTDQAVWIMYKSSSKLWILFSIDSESPIVPG